ncbi:MAG: hypothetical protein GF331_01260 [Chitinivibrionales bacterium]|nr:hypothetical protein [Chitinivibrionales bacterium]
MEGEGVSMKLVTSIVALALVAHASAAPYTELVPEFDRIESRAMVRLIAVPTLANLDYAAYNANPVRHDPKKFKPKPEEDVTIEKMRFGGAMVSFVNTLNETPLTDAEKEQPMAWKALENRLWELTKDPGWQAVAGKIASEKFGDRKVFKPFQEVAAVYLHEGAEGPEIWARVEFMPWVKFLEGVSDENEDEFKEVYGRLVLDKVQPENVEKAVAWIRDDYTKTTLKYQQVRDWINILASYWYPTMNTDLVEMGDDTTWPTAQTERKVVKELDGVTVDHPVAVVRGNPFGEPVYNVYVVEGMRGEETESAATGEHGAPKEMDTTVSENFKANQARFAEELKAHGGSYDKWAKQNDEHLSNMQEVLEGLPEDQMGFKGKGDWVFFRKSLEYMTAGDLSEQSKEKNPLPHLVEFQNYLAEHDINMLFVVIPTKADIYYEQLPTEMPAEPDVVINPYGRKFLADAQEAGVEVIDVLPRLLKAKAGDAEADEDLYQHQDTHWTNRGLQIAAELIAERVKQYAWYGDLAEKKVDYTVEPTTFSRQGDIVDKLPEADQGNYPPLTLKAEQVKTPDGNLYKPNHKTGPIMLIGDSFTGVFELVDCKGAGVGAHVAAKTGLPVDVITSWGGGPLVRQKMLRGRKKDLGHKRLVVYLMVARDLYNYAQSWSPLKTGK